MSVLGVSPSGTHLRREGTAFPLIVDTAWGALGNAQIDDWDSYTALRRGQGFTSVAISLLPILHDRTILPSTRYPFGARGNDAWDFDNPNVAYFATAREFAEIAAANGLVLTVALLWCNYIPGTWGARLTPSAVMTAAQRSAFVTQALDTFHGLEPLILVSGDDSFDGPESTSVYREVMDQVEAQAPCSLVGAHSTPDATIPPEILESPNLDVYVYQSGHDVGRQSLTYELGTKYASLVPRRPVINIEPCYEQIGHFRGTGRFGREDVRRAAWYSLLGGSTAGIGYGAHGSWQWHDSGGFFTNRREYGDLLTWREALSLPGALDITFAAGLWFEHALFDLAPRQDVSATTHGHVRIAADSQLDRIALYLPHGELASVRRDLRGYQIKSWSLTDRRVIEAQIQMKGNLTYIRQPDAFSDSFVLLTR